MNMLRSVLAAAAFATAVPALAQGQGAATLYTLGSFAGHTLKLRDGTANFEPLGFNDTARSMRIERGTWELCDDSFYRGNCRIYGPGEYRDLGGQTGRVSSARLVASAAPGWGPQGAPGTYEGPRDRWERVGDGDVVVFDARDFRGYLATLTVPTRNFGPLGFNDRVASMVVRRGLWEFCTDSEYRGNCRVYGPGEYPSLSGGQDDAYSSARPVQSSRGERNPVGRRGRASIILFDHGAFAGRSITLDGPAEDLERFGFNDRVNSVIVEAGRWRLCSDAQGRGACREFGPGRYPALPRELGSRLSSVYRANRAK